MLSGFLNEHETSSEIQQIKHKNIIVLPYKDKQPSEKLKTSWKYPNLLAAQDFQAEQQL